MKLKYFKIILNKCNIQLKRKWYKNINDWIHCILLKLKSNYNQIQTVRPAPTIPERVAYYSTAEVKRDFEKDPGDWIQVKDDFVIGKFDANSGVMEKLVTVNNNLDVTVRFGGICLFSFFFKGSDDVSWIL